MYLDANKETAIAKLLKRGRWGEADSPLLTDKDRPEIEKLFDVMNREMSKRLDCTKFEAIEGDIDGTYQQLLALVSD